MQGLAPIVKPYPRPPWPLYPRERRASVRQRRFRLALTFQHHARRAFAAGQNRLGEKMLFRHQMLLLWNMKEW